MMPDPAARDPHTLVFDHNGDIWFTVQGGNFVGKLGTRTGSVELMAVPTEDARPYGIVVDADNRAWFCELGTNKLATVDPETFELQELELPRADSRPRRLQVTSDGKVWYVDYAGGYLGQLDPQSGEAKEWMIPGGADARPYGMAIDDKDRPWFVETGPHRPGWSGSTPRPRNSSKRLRSRAGEASGTCTSTPRRERSGLGPTRTPSVAREYRKAPTGPWLSVGLAAASSPASRSLLSGRRSTSMGRLLPTPEGSTTIPATGATSTTTSTTRLGR